MRTVILGAALALAAASTGQAATLRIAAVEAASSACAPLGGGAPAGEKAYYKLLEQRLGRDILKCPVASRAEAASALSAGKLDLAVLDMPSWEPIKANTRAILTVRPQGALNRIPVVVATKAASAPAGLQALKGKKAAFGGVTPAAFATPRKALADQGLDPAFFSVEEKLSDSDAAAKALRSGAADVLVLNASAWQRLCRGDKPKEDHCGDLKVVWRGRPRAPLAMVVRTDMPLDEKFQIIGIHVAMHLEAKDAFAWASSWVPGGAEFEATEADALVVAAR